MTVRLILDAVDDVQCYADFELILEIALALANDIGESLDECCYLVITARCQLHVILQMVHMCNASDGSQV